MKGKELNNLTLHISLHKKLHMQTLGDETKFVERVSKEIKDISGIVCDDLDSASMSHCEKCHIHRKALIVPDQPLRIRREI